MKQLAFFTISVTRFMKQLAFFTISVTRLGGVLKLSVTNLIVKVAQIFGDFGGSFDNHSI